MLINRYFIIELKKKILICGPKSNIKEYKNDNVPRYSKTKNIIEQILNINKKAIQTDRQVIDTVAGNLLTHLITHSLTDNVMFRSVDHNLVICGLIRTFFTVLSPRI